MDLLWHRCVYKRKYNISEMDLQMEQRVYSGIRRQLVWMDKKWK